jgi:hypothetical protein
MKNCQIICSNAAQRNLYLTILHAAGFEFAGLLTPKDFIAPFYDFVHWPIILIIDNKIDLGRRLNTRSNWPVVNISQVISERVKSEEAAATPPISYPAPAKYSLTYRTTRGEIKSYTISNPIEADANKFTAYAFGKGVRCFHKNRISQFAKLG